MRIGWGLRGVREGRTAGYSTISCLFNLFGTGVDSEKQVTSKGLLQHWDETVALNVEEQRGGEDLQSAYLFLEGAACELAGSACWT